MPLQPYFPEPIAVLRNVAEARHKLRVAFVRRVVLGHFLSVLVVAVCALIVPTQLPIGFLAGSFFLGLVLLSIQRRTLFGGNKDNALSLIILAPSLFFLGQLLRVLHDLGWPVLALIPATASLAVYALLCGNDFSYVGQFVLCSVVTIMSLVAMWAAGEYSVGQVWIGSTLAIAFLLYFAYDLSMMVKRRRFKEEPAAVADLYRDLLNIVTYSVRVYFHWRKFRFM